MKIITFVEERAMTRRRGVTLRRFAVLCL